MPTLPTVYGNITPTCAFCAFICHLGFLPAIPVFDIIDCVNAAPRDQHQSPNQKLLETKMEPSSKKPRTGDYINSTCDSTLSADFSPQLPYEAIAHVARFASTSGKAKKNDLQNICVAVGKKNIDLIRRAFLKKNYGYLQRSMRRFKSKYEFVVKSVDRNSIDMGPIGKCQRNIKEWMAINADWKELVTAERIRDCSYRSLTSQRHTYHLAIFNNISLATSLGLVSVVRHLIEDMSMDINGYYAFRIRSKWPRAHILATAFQFYDDIDTGMLNYLLSFDSIDVSAISEMFADGGRPDLSALSSQPIAGRIGRLALTPCCPPECLQTVVEHRSFDHRIFPGCLMWNLFYSGRNIAVIVREGRDLTEEERDNFIAKAKIIVRMASDEQNPVLIDWERTLKCANMYLKYSSRNNMPNMADFFLAASEELKKYQD